MAAVRALALEGASVILLPSYLATEDLAAGRLVEVLPEASLPKLSVFACFPHHRASLSKINVVVTELRNTSHR
jgi:DNA-binding transcriptional LysR family regulator